VNFKQPLKQPIHPFSGPGEKLRAQSLAASGGAGTRLGSANNGRFFMEIDLTPVF